MATCLNTVANKIIQLDGKVPIVSFTCWKGKYGLWLCSYTAVIILCIREGKGKKNISVLFLRNTVCASVYYRFIYTNAYMYMYSYR